MRQVEACAGQKLDVTAIDARHAIAVVVLYFMDPALACRRFFDEARPLRLHPFWRPIDFFHDDRLD
jgi:hypothetical protein